MCLLQGLVPGPIEPGMLDQADHSLYPGHLVMLQGFDVSGELLCHICYAGNQLEFQYRLSLAQNRLINQLITGSN